MGKNYLLFHRHVAYLNIALENTPKGDYMRTSSAKAIVGAADNLGLPVSHHENYSGRGMFGKTTDGVVGKINDIIASAAYAASLLKEDYFSDCSDISRHGEKKHDDLIHDLQHVRTDNMAMDIIVY